jgi:hypothetical protein
MNELFAFRASRVDDPSGARIRELLRLYQSYERVRSTRGLGVMGIVFSSIFLCAIALWPAEVSDAVRWSVAFVWASCAAVALIAAFVERRLLKMIATDSLTLPPQQGS